MEAGRLPFLPSHYIIGQEKMAIQKVCMSSFVEMNHCSGFPVECTKNMTTTASTAPQVKFYSLPRPAQAKDTACRDGRLYSVNTSTFSITVFPQIVTVAFIYPNCRGLTSIQYMAIFQYEASLFPNLVPFSLLKICYCITLLTNSHTPAVTEMVYIVELIKLN